MIATLYTLGLLSMLSLIAAGAPGPSTDPGDWGVNFGHWVITKGGTLVVLACTVICIVGVAHLIGGNGRKGLTTIGTGLVGILLGAWITSGGAATFIQSFQHA